MSEMSDAIRELMAEKGLSEESVKLIVENTIKAAFKSAYGQDQNCIVKFTDNLDVEVYARKVILDGVYDPTIEIELEEAKEYFGEDCEVGDEVDIKIDPKTFERSAISTGKSRARQNLNENFKKNLYNEFKSKVGEVIIGYYQREQNGNIYVNLGKVDGVLPVRNQNPRESFGTDDRIKAYVTDIKEVGNGIQVILSRAAPEFVKSLLSVEVPEISDGKVQIYKVVREAGYRTKVAVYSDNDSIDPVGSCVGPKGMRINNVIRELEGEKIDVLKYDTDPRVFIKNALSPAEVIKVLITDVEKKEALAIVADSQFSLAIGKTGQNVRLANKLCDWMIDVKRESEVADMDLSEIDTRKAAEQLFAPVQEQEEVEYEFVSQLPGVDASDAEILKAAGYDDFASFVEAEDDGSLYKVEGLTEEKIHALKDIVLQFVEIEDVDETEDAEVESEEEYFCPECGAKITLDMTKCPNCGAEFEFEEN